MKSRSVLWPLTDPATWETFESGAMDSHIAEISNTRSGNQRREGGKGIESRRGRDERGEVPRRQDNGWEGRREGMRNKGNGNGNGNTQTEASNHGNVFDAESKIRDKGTGLARQRREQEIQTGGGKGCGLGTNTFWAGKEKDMRTWLEEMEELEGLESLKAKGSQNSVL